MVMDKRTEIISIRVPDAIKGLYDKLGRTDRERAIDAMLVALARVIHETKFRPEDYLGE